MTSTIVCGVDIDAEGCDRPLGVAGSLSRRTGDALVVAYVAAAARVGAGGRGPDSAGIVAGPTPALPYPYPLPADDEALEAARDEAHRRLVRLVDQCGLDGAATEVLLDPSPAEGLRRLAAERDAELLVVGSRGHGAIRAALLGSTSHSLAGDAPCPVVVVPPDQ